MPTNPEFYSQLRHQDLTHARQLARAEQAPGLHDVLEVVSGIKQVPLILDVICRLTGMRFAAVARVTEERWFACSVHDDMGFNLKPGDELQLETTMCHQIRQSGRAVVVDNLADDPDHSNHPVVWLYGLQSYISVPIRLADGQFFGTLCAIDKVAHRLNTPEVVATFEMFADIIGHHLDASARLTLSEETLTDERRASALREQFIAVLGHDLRNPLASIEGGLRLLLSTGLSEKAIGIVRMAQTSTRRMSGLIDDVMDLARGRLGGGLTLAPKVTTPLEPVLRHVVDELRGQAAGRVIDAQLHLVEPVDCDHARMSQLVSNLLGNALTHGDTKIPVVVRATALDGWFEFSVANAGDMIPASLLPTLFLPFARDKLRPSLQGLGLGLYISSEIARAHGGTLTVSSTEQETKFTFRMPTNPVAS